MYDMTASKVLIASGLYSDVHVRSRNDITTTGVVTQWAYLSKTLTIRGGYTILPNGWRLMHRSLRRTQALRRKVACFTLPANISPTLRGCA